MPEITPYRHRTDCSWADIPHLDEKMKAEMLASYPPHMRDARTQGIPSQGIGAVYPIDIERLLVAPRQIPSHWPRAYALDAGWKCTAVLWGAMHVEEDCLYLISEHYQGHWAPALHAAAIKARGAWQRGTADAFDIDKKDGEQMIATYRALGLNLIGATSGWRPAGSRCSTPCRTGVASTAATTVTWSRPRPPRRSSLRKWTIT
jgi:hypothetical protein